LVLSHIIIKIWDQIISCQLTLPFRKRRGRRRGNEIIFNPRPSISLFLLYRSYIWLNESMRSNEWMNEWMVSLPLLNSRLRLFQTSTFKVNAKNQRAAHYSLKSSITHEEIFVRFWSIWTELEIFPCSQFLSLRPPQDSFFLSKTAKIAILLNFGEIWGYWGSEIFWEFSKNSLLKTKSLFPAVQKDSKEVKFVISANLKQNFYISVIKITLVPDESMELRVEIWLQNYFIRPRIEIWIVFFFLR